MTTELHLPVTRVRLSSLKKVIAVYRLHVDRGVLAWDVSWSVFFLNVIHRSNTTPLLAQVMWNASRPESPCRYFHTGLSTSSSDQHWFNHKSLFETYIPLWMLVILLLFPIQMFTASGNLSTAWCMILFVSWEDTKEGQCTYQTLHYTMGCHWEHLLSACETLREIPRHHPQNSLQKTCFRFVIEGSRSPCWETSTCNQISKVKDFNYELIALHPRRAWKGILTWSYAPRTVQQNTVDHQRRGWLRLRG